MFNVVESYTRALNASRMERGEPISGVVRQVWKARQWTNQNRWTVGGSATFILAAIGSIAFLLSHRSKQSKIPDALSESRAA